MIGWGSSAFVPCQDDGTSTLDVIVEAPVLVSVTSQVVEGLLGLEVLELDDHVGVDLSHGLHEFVHELLGDSRGGTPGTKTEVQRVLQVGLIVGTRVQHNGKGLAGVDTSSAGVERQLANLGRCQPQVHRTVH